MFGDLTLVGGLWVHTCTQMLTYLAILTKMNHIFLYVTTNICYNSAKPYIIHQSGHLIDKKNLSRVKCVKLWSINPLLAVTQKNDFFFPHLFALLLYSAMPFPQLTIMSMH